MLPRWSAHPCGSQHQTVYQNTATLLKPSIISDRLNSVQCVSCREDIAAAKWESARRNIKSQICQPPRPRPSYRYAAWVVSGKQRGKEMTVKDTGGSHSHVLGLSSVLTAAVTRALQQSMTVASMFSMLIFKTIPAFAHVRLRACYGCGQPHNNATLGLNLLILLLLNYLKRIRWCGCPAPDMTVRHLL